MDWERIRALLEHDVLYRARQIADGGPPQRAVCRPRPVRWAGTMVVLHRWNATATTAQISGSTLDERGLLLIPSVFAGPHAMTVTAAQPGWQPTLIYPARGVGDAVGLAV